MKHILPASALFLMLCASVAGWWLSRPQPRASNPLPHDVYVWQRSWTKPVQNAVSEHATNFSELVVLGAEVAWENGRPKITRAAIDYATPGQAEVPVGLALRIGSYNGPFADADPVAQLLAELAESMIAEARSNSISPSELQLDFDCAESKLAGYRVWLQAVQRRVAPLPVTITALPSWLGSDDFPSLAKQATNYVLQVHSLERPRDIRQRFVLCDPEAARRAVERASTIGVPFRVALPTYGYLLAFDRNGKFIGLSAEGAVPLWPRDAQIRELRSDPVEMAALVGGWNTNRPAALRGIIWYRLPVSVDNLNWRWPTLGAIVASGSLRESLRVESRRVEAGLVEISLVNDSTLDISSRLAVEVRWPRTNGVRLVAADGLNGFTLNDDGASTVQFLNGLEINRYPAGETFLLGWLRFDRDCEVQIELKKK